MLWLLTTVALAAAVPAVWAQLHIVDEDGYAALAATGRGGPRPAGRHGRSNSTTQVLALGADKGYTLNPQLVRTVADSYTRNSGFPGQFAQANGIAHR